MGNYIDDKQSHESSHISAAYPQLDTMGACLGKSAYPQIVVLGLSGAGKTTLLYRLKLPQARNNIQFETPTKGFHYEEVRIGREIFGVWDVPGSDAMKEMWPVFYRYVKVSAVIFVFNMTEKDKNEKVREARERLCFLVNEDELRETVFCVLLNTGGTDSRQTANADIEKEAMAVKLGLRDLQREPGNSKRLKWYLMNVANGDKEREWKTAAEWMCNFVAAMKG
eukprot:GDKI01036057.1.p1 GENE.GDKI01036057.1~~GDKI01036057.1.p1  ORF type:complete len:224 (-),score=30.90 GDKI01036057.1:47-718(-)